jgi:hypothetical protein
MELSSLNQRVLEHEEALAEDVYREEFVLLEKQLALIQREQAQLEKESRTAVHDPDEARTRLLSKAKADNTRMTELKAVAEDLAHEMERQRQLRDELDADISAQSGGGQEASKYDELYRRDEEMTEFIDRYPNQRAKELAEQAVSPRNVAVVVVADDEAGACSGRSKRSRRCSGIFRPASPENMQCRRWSRARRWRRI